MSVLEKRRADNIINSAHSIVPPYVKKKKVNLDLYFLP